jgi:hypothetical protein
MNSCIICTHYQVLLDDQLEKVAMDRVHGRHGSDERNILNISPKTWKKQTA